MLLENEILWSLTVLTMRPESVSQGQAVREMQQQNWKNEDARETIYMTLAGSQKPWPLQPADCKWSEAFYFGDHQLVCGTI